jgi:hypothetical protein
LRSVLAERNFNKASPSRRATWRDVTYTFTPPAFSGLSTMGAEMISSEVIKATALKFFQKDFSLLQPRSRWRGFDMQFSMISPPFGTPDNLPSYLIFPFSSRALCTMATLFCDVRRRFPIFARSCVRLERVWEGEVPA